MPDVGLNSFKNNILNLSPLVKNRADSRADLLVSPPTMTAS
jgi:hypothetical protein